MDKKYVNCISTVLALSMEAGIIRKLLPDYKFMLGDKCSVLFVNESFIFFHIYIYVVY